MFKASLWRLGAAVALSAVALVGCGDDDDDNGTPGTGGSAGEGTGGNGTGGATGGTGGTGGNMGGDGGMGGNGQLQNLFDTAVADGEFTTLVALIERVELEDTLEGNGPLTMFAPTDDAFEAFEDENPGVLDALTDEEVDNLLRYHLVDGALQAEDLEDAEELETLADDNPTITVNVSNGDVTLTDGSGDTEDAAVTEADIEASNGVIHAIDGVLLPPENG